MAGQGLEARIDEAQAEAANAARVLRDASVALRSVDRDSDLDEAEKSLEEALKLVTACKESAR